MKGQGCCCCLPLCNGLTHHGQRSSNGENIKRRICVTWRDFTSRCALKVISNVCTMLLCRWTHKTERDTRITRFSVSRDTDTIVIFVGGRFPTSLDISVSDSYIIILFSCDLAVCILISYSFAVSFADNATLEFSSPKLRPHHSRANDPRWMYPTQNPLRPWKKTNWARHDSWNWSPIVVSIKRYPNWYCNVLRKLPTLHHRHRLLVLRLRNGPK